MSSTIQQYFTPDNLNMLRRALDDAGCHYKANGFFHHLYQDMSERARAREFADFEAWENEGGALAKSRPNRQPSLRLVSGQATIVRRIMLGFPAFSLSNRSLGAEDGDLCGIGRDP